MKSSTRKFCGKKLRLPENIDKKKIVLSHPYLQIFSEDHSSIHFLASSKMVTDNDHTVPSEEQQPNNKRPHVEVEPMIEVDGERKRKKVRRVNFNLTIDIKQDDACVPQGPHSLSDFSDVESLAEPIPTTPGGKPQVRSHFSCR